MPQNQKQVFLELSRAVARGGKSDLRAGGFLGTFLPEKSTRRIYTIHLIN